MHFAYVLVSNRLGGYTERRIGINTDSLAGPQEDGGEQGDDVELYQLKAPAAPAQVGDYYRGRVDASNTSAAGRDVYLPNVPVSAEDLHTNAVYPPNGVVLTDEKGEYVIPGIPGTGTGGATDPGSNDVAATCQIYGTSDDIPALELPRCSPMRRLHTC